MEDSYSCSNQQQLTGSFPKLSLKYSLSYLTIDSCHTPFSLLVSHPSLFFLKQSFTKSIHLFCASPTGWLPIHPSLYNFFFVLILFLYFYYYTTFNIANPLWVFQQFCFHPFFILTNIFGILSILTPKNHVKLFTFKTLILDQSFPLHTSIQIFM